MPITLQKVRTDGFQGPQLDRIGKRNTYTPVSRDRSGGEGEGDFLFFLGFAVFLSFSLPFWVSKPVP